MCCRSLKISNSTRLPRIHNTTLNALVRCATCPCALHAGTLIVHTHILFSRKKKEAGKAPKRHSKQVIWWYLFLPLPLLGLLLLLLLPYRYNVVAPPTSWRMVKYQQKTERETLGIFCPPSLLCRMWLYSKRLAASRVLCRVEWDDHKLLHKHTGILYVGRPGKATANGDWERAERCWSVARTWIDQNWDVGREYEAAKGGQIEVRFISTDKNTEWDMIIDKAWTPTTNKIRYTDKSSRVIGETFARKTTAPHHRRLIKMGWDNFQVSSGENQIINGWQTQN